jgi:hypothetical protein
MALCVIVIHRARRRLPRIAALAPFLPLYAVASDLRPGRTDTYDVILSRFRR